jgi:hypothetical protein
MIGQGRVGQGKGRQGNKAEEEQIIAGKARQGMARQDRQEEEKDRKEGSKGQIRTLLRYNPSNLRVVGLLVGMFSILQEIFIKMTT